MDLEVGQIVLCTVDRIVGTNVFVKIHAGTKEIEGCIVTSEIAPGRIRNIRDYVVPKKKIVCKILRISGDRIDLSLRRVTQKEQKEIKEQDNQEKSYESILKSVLGEKSGEIMEKIQKRDSIYNFLQNAKENAKELESLVGRENTKKIIDILKNQKQKKAVLKKEIFLTTTKPNGIILIKNFLENFKEVDIKYISAGRYFLKSESENIKKMEKTLQKIILEFEKEAKIRGMEFSIQKK